MLKINAQAPEITSKTHNGNAWALSEAVKTGPVLLFFYPKDFTPVCSKEACVFRDLRQEFADLGAQVVGISADNDSSHQRFSSKHGLNYPLISDSDRRIAKAYKATFFGVMPKRVTYVIDSDRRIAGAFHSELSAEKHAEFAKKTLASLAQATG